MKECNANEWIPGNIHSLETMICDICKKETSQAGSSYLAGHEICYCCDIKIEKHLKTINLSEVEDVFFEQAGNKRIFLRNKWRISEIERRMK